MNIRMMKREIYGYLELFLLGSSASLEFTRDRILGDNPTDASMARFERAKVEVAQQLGSYSFHRKRWLIQAKKEIEEWNRIHGTDGPKS